MQVTTVFTLIVVLWAIYGYSLALTEGNPIIGGLSQLFLAGTTADSTAGTFTDASVNVPAVLSAVVPARNNWESPPIIGLPSVRAREYP